MEWWRRLKSFEWDEGNRHKNKGKHGVDWREAEEIFANDPLLVSPDASHSTTEKRHHALGVTGKGRWLHITFTVRGEKMRIISARPMSKKERSIYEKT